MPSGGLLSARVRIFSGRFAQGDRYRLSWARPCCSIISRTSPRIRPTFWQLVFTYLIPILPLMLGWDNVVSCLRTYSGDELRGFASQLQSDDYHWEIGELQNPRLPTPYPYIMGYPTRRSSAEPDFC